MEVNEAVFVEVFVDSIGEQGTHAEGRGKGVGSRAKVGDCAEVFQGVTFFL